MAKSRFSFFVASEMVVVGYNPEMADMDNREGAIIRERFYMVAEDVNGARRRYGSEETEAGAETVFQHFAPAVTEWAEARPAYGSVAYQNSGAELDQRRSEMEYDLGSDWMNHPQVSLEVRTQLF